MLDEKQIKKNQYTVFLIAFLIFLLVAFFITQKIFFMLGANTICENSGGIAVIRDNKDYRAAECFIEYDKTFNQYGNNLYLNEEDVNKIKKAHYTK